MTDRDPARRTRRTTRGEYYAETRERLENARSAPPGQEFWLMTLRFGELRVEAHLTRCAEISARLEELMRQCQEDKETPT